MNQSLILDLLENTARLSSQDLADILNDDEASIKSEIQSLEKNKIICGYHTIINYNKALKDQKVLAYIEVSCTPTRNRGYDKTAALIANYPEVDTMYLLSGDCDFLCLVQGKTMFEVARFQSTSAGLWLSERGRPYLSRASRYGSGSNSSTVCTPLVVHLPVSSISAPHMAGTPVV